MKDWYLAVASFSETNTMTDLTMGTLRGTVRQAIGWAVFALSACGGTTTGPGASDGAVVEDASAGEASSGPGACVGGGGTCNSIVDVASPIAPTCASGAVPAGTGGVIADGTYVLTAQTYYGVASCPTTRLSTTLVIAGGCYQVAAHAFEGDGGSIEVRGSSSVAVQDNHLTLSPTCTTLSGTQDAPTKTFTASGSMLMLFTANAAAGSGNPDRVEVFVRQ